MKKEQIRDLILESASYATKGRKGTKASGIDVDELSETLYQKFIEFEEDAFNAGGEFEVPGDLHYGLKNPSYEKWKDPTKTT